MHLLHFFYFKYHSHSSNDQLPPEAESAGVEKGRGGMILFALWNRCIKQVTCKTPTSEKSNTISCHLLPTKPQACVNWHLRQHRWHYDIKRWPVSLVSHLRSNFQCEFLSCVSFRLSITLSSGELVNSVLLQFSKWCVIWD